MTYKVLVLSSTLLVAGCAGGPVGSITGGECKIVHTPEYSVRGKTQYDQRWVSGTTESLVRGCGQPRPKARPASFDAPPVAVKAKAPLTVAPKVKQQKRGWWRFRVS